MRMVRSEGGDYSLDEVIESEEKVDITRPEMLDSAVQQEKEDDLESEIENLEKDIKPDDSVEKKIRSEKNPVEELEKKLQDEREKVQKIRDSEPGENLFDKPESDLEDNPFEA